MLASCLQVSLKMRADWIVFLIPLLCTEITPLEWTSDLQDGADVYACEGDNITLPWGYTLQDGETVEDVKWYYDQQHGGPVSIAVTVEGQFFQLPTPFSNRIHQAGEAGLALTSLTARDRGNYSVRVTVLSGSTFATYNRTASLILVEDELDHQREALWAQLEPETVYDNKTSQLHVQLTCGGYVITGPPPVYVEWTFPSGKTELVSTHVNGTFVLTLPNPVEGGNYTCRLGSRLPPLSCLSQNGSTLGSASVFVDEVKMRLSLLESGHELIRTEKQGLQAEIDLLKEENRKLSDIAGSHQTYLQDVVRFDVRPTGNYDYTSPQRVIFDHVITNEGSGYNMSTGVFTAPFNGTYFFILTVAQYGLFSSAASLVDDTTTLCQLQLVEALVYVGLTCQATVYRARGQHVWIESNEHLYLSGNYSSFSGFSLNFDISTTI